MAPSSPPHLPPMEIAPDARMHRVQCPHRPHGLQDLLSLPVVLCHALTSPLLLGSLAPVVNNRHCSIRPEEGHPRIAHEYGARLREPLRLLHAPASAAPRTRSRRHDSRPVPQGQAARRLDKPVPTPAARWRTVLL